MGAVVHMKLWKLLHTPAPWETKSENEAIIARLRGLPLVKDDSGKNDPQNPNAR